MKWLNADKIIWSLCIPEVKYFGFDKDLTDKNFGALWCLKYGLMLADVIINRGKNIEECLIIYTWSCKESQRTLCTTLFLDN
jgi:hypothetical protein